MKISVIDDHPVVREGLIHFLNLDMDIEANGFSSDDELFKYLNTESPDLIIVDLIVPGLSPEERVSKIIAVNRSIKIAVLTSSFSTDNIIPLLNLGISGYLLKDIEPDQLIISIKNIINGQTVFSPFVSDYLINNKSDNNLITGLSEREKDVLHHLGQGNTNKEIAQHLSISESTVKTHISSLLGKLSLKHRTQLAIFSVKNSLTISSNKNGTYC